jgi:hypothetical protein
MGRLPACNKGDRRAATSVGDLVSMLDWTVGHVAPRLSSESSRLRVAVLGLVVSTAVAVVSGGSAFADIVIVKESVVDSVGCRE